MSANTNLVSILLGVYNQEEYIEDCIRSILNQSHKNIELIISNNGSTDRSIEKIKKYKNDERITIIDYVENCNLGFVANNAINYSTGKYICFIAGDDRYEEKYIEKNLSVLEELPSTYGVVYSSERVQRFDGSNSSVYNKFTKSGYVFEDLIKAQITGYISAFTPFYRKEVFEDFIFDETVFSEGEAIAIRIAYKYKYQYINDILYISTQHENNQGKNYKENSTFFLKMSIKRLEQYPSHKKLIKITIAKMFIRNAWLAFRVLNDRDWSRECLKISFKYYRGSIFNLKFLFILFMNLFKWKEFNHNLNKEFIDVDYASAQSKSNEFKIIK